MIFYCYSCNNNAFFHRSDSFNASSYSSFPSYFNSCEWFMIHPVTKRLLTLVFQLHLFPIYPLIFLAEQAISLFSPQILVARNMQATRLWNEFEISHGPHSQSKGPTEAWRRFYVLLSHDSENGSHEVGRISVASKSYRIFSHRLKWINFWHLARTNAAPADVNWLWQKGYRYPLVQKCNQPA